MKTVPSAFSCRFAFLLGGLLFLPAAPSAIAQRVPDASQEQAASPPRAEAKTEHLTAATRRALGAGKEHMAPSARVAALHQLSIRLPRADCAALLGCMENGPSPDFPPKLWHVFVNDAADVLLKQETPVNGLVDFLTTSARTQTDPVLRDYALQKLGTVTAGRKDVNLSNLTLPILAEASTTPGQDFQGTALLAWRAALGPAATSDRPFKKAIQACLASKEATVAARVAALQAGASAGLEEVRAPARLVLTKHRQEAPLALQLCAVAALGQTGKLSEDEALISPLQDHVLLGLAARTALSRLESRP